MLFTLFLDSIAVLNFLSFSGSSLYTLALINKFFCIYCFNFRKYQFELIVPSLLFMLQQCEIILQLPAYFFAVILRYGHCYLLFVQEISAEDKRKTHQKELALQLNEEAKVNKSEIFDHRVHDLRLSPF